MEIITWRPPSINIGICCRQSVASGESTIFLATFYVIYYFCIWITNYSSSTTSFRFFSIISALALFIQCFKSIFFLSYSEFLWIFSFHLMFFFPHFFFLLHKFQSDDIVFSACNTRHVVMVSFECTQPFVFQFYKPSIWFK